MSQADSIWVPLTASVDKPPDKVVWLALVPDKDRITDLGADQIDIGVFRPVDTLIIVSPLIVYGLHTRDGVQLLIPSFGVAPIAADASQKQDVEVVRSFVHAPGTIAYWLQTPLPITGTPNLFIRTIREER